MNTTSTAYNSNVIYTRPNYTVSTIRYDSTCHSLDEVKKNNVLMCHSPSDVKEASKLFPSYLTDEELQERQCKGRFWDVSRTCLYILVDNETLVIVGKNGNVNITGRERLPYSLQGIYYFDEY